MQTNLALVSLKKIKSNALAISRAAGSVPLIAVVKDDGYGHGAVQVAHALRGIASSFAVATVEEGIALRLGGIVEDILVLTPPLCTDEVVRGAGYGLIFTLSSLATLRLTARTAQEYALSPRAHIAVNTGMNRMGFRPERTHAACRAIAGTRIACEGIYSHFYAPELKERTERQFALFLQACAGAERVFPHLTRHIAATGGILAGEKYRLDAVRSGIALYGYLPSGFEGKLNVQPAMKVYSHVVQSGKFTGGGVGYAPVIGKLGTLKTLRLGYGDGLFRAGGNGAIGKLCMDAQVCEGSSRMGRRELIFSDVSRYAREMGTIPYEILCRIGTKAVRRYE